MNSFKIRSKAAMFSKFFKFGKLATGESELYISADAPFELNELIVKVQDGFGSDRYRYRFLHEALLALSTAKEPLMLELEADWHAEKLVKWLESNPDRLKYCDKVFENHLADESMICHLSAGQYLEKQEVLSSVLRFLEDLEENRYEPHPFESLAHAYHA